jgi:cold shock CspA family protein
VSRLKKNSGTAEPDFADRQFGDREWPSAQSNGSIQARAMDSFSLKAADVFVHIFAVERAGLSTLKEGQQIEYEIVEDRGKTTAVKLKSSDPSASLGQSLRRRSRLGPFARR